MTINKTEDGTTLVLALEGRLDTTTAPELEAVLKESLNGVGALVLDMEGLVYLSSAGLRVTGCTEADEPTGKHGGKIRK